MNADFVKALAVFQSMVPPIPKDKTGKVTGVTKSGKPYEYTYKYADLATIIAAIREPLAKNDLAFTQVIEDDMLKTIVMHVCGETIESLIPLNLEGLDAQKKGLEPQKKGSLITYMRRYALCPILGIVGEDDDDGAAAQGRDAVYIPQQTSRQTVDSGGMLSVERLDAISATIDAQTDIGLLKTARDAGMKEAADARDRVAYDKINQLASTRARIIRGKENEKS